MGAWSTKDQLLTGTDMLCSAGVMAIPFSPKFKVPHMEVYDGSKDPLEHLETFKAHMTLHGFSREVVCQAFLLTLKRVAWGWFGSLPLGSMNSFGKLARPFLM